MHNQWRVSTVDDAAILKAQITVAAIDSSTLARLCLCAMYIVLRTYKRGTGQRHPAWIQGATS